MVVPVSPEPKEELRESWFAKPVVPSVPPMSMPPPPPPERDHSLTFGYGAAAGAFGAVGAFFFAAWVSGRFGPQADIASMVGRTVARGELTGFAIGAGIGALLGGILTLVMRHAARFVARVIFGTVSSAGLWFCLHLALVSRHRATLPLVPMLLGVCVYAVVVALVPPSR